MRSWYIPSFQVIDIWSERLFETWERNLDGWLGTTGTKTVANRCRHTDWCSLVTTAVMQGRYCNCRGRNCTSSGARKLWQECAAQVCKERETILSQHCPNLSQLAGNRTIIKQFMARKIWGFHGYDYKDSRLLGCYTVWLLYFFAECVGC
jgi:hypothetical protein